LELRNEAGSLCGVGVAPVLLLTWLSLRATNPEAELFDRALAELDRFATIENALYRDVFTARVGTLLNYDPLVTDIDALHSSCGRLRETAALDATTTAAVERLAESVDRQEELVERFKSDNALLRNSLSFFGRFSTHPSSADLGAAISAAAAAMLHLTLDTSATTAREVQDRLDDLAALARPSDDDPVGPLLAHGRLLHRLLPAVDNVLKMMDALPQKQEQDALRALLLTQQSASRATARKLRLGLYGISLLLVAFLVHLGVRLRKRANALRRRAALEHVIAGISVRFINVQRDQIDAEIDRALAELGRCIGSDRAYFVSSRPTPRVRIWSKPGVNSSSGWPAGALALAARLGRTIDGIVHVPRVSRLSAGENRNSLTALGLEGWACATNIDDDGAGVTLGFDTIGRPCPVTVPGELSLLRMALDTIVYAAERHRMQREQSQLEMRLQEARRMERIGALTSGIAHNFNNILGGIFGHLEMLDERLDLDARLGASLEAIRRAAERARDLVDQILTFGRRRDAHRGLVRVHSLLAETTSLLNAALPAGIELAIEESAVSAVVSGQAAQLQQVIFNLCNNAVQAMDDGGRIVIETEEREIASSRRLSHDELQPGRYVCIAVTDTGRGMDEATQGRIFEPFFTTRSSGNGLGLATVREIVREHNGAMNVRSTLGEGSRFEIWLPCGATADEVSDRNLPALAVGHGETILMAASDDGQLLRDEEMLAALGYEPVGFCSAAAALSACQKGPDRFDALIVGQLGSAASSFELATALHRIAPSLPIVLATRSTGGINSDALVPAGITDVVHWPLIAAEIAAALQHRGCRSYL
jgi:signal transduction histidine kinase/uncharacterized protein with PIN domain